MLMTLYNLSVIPSFSRPRVSDDNPYSESLFKTLKYAAGYPKHFQDLSHARQWMAGFVDRYNTAHLHWDTIDLGGREKQKGIPSE